MERAANPWWVLIGSCTGLFILMLDSTVVTLALPSIQRDLGTSTDGAQWVQNAYLLTLTATVVTAGRLGDLRGRRRVFVIGMVLFAAGSVLAGAAGSTAVLIAGRVLQGVGGAGMLALSLALTSRAFPRERQAQALGIWAAVSAVALAIGPLLGGVLIEAASWRWIFFVNVPVAVAGIVVMQAKARDSRERDAAPVDLAGAAVLGAGLTAIVLALVEADNWAWTSARTLAVLGAGIATLAGFAVLERHRRAPLVDFALFRNGPYLGASAAAFALVGSYWVMMFFEPQYLQSALGYSAIEAGALVLPITVPMAVFSPFAPRLIAALGVRATMTAGMAIGLAGVILTAAQQDTGTYAALILGFLCFGIALALVYAPMSTAAMASMPADKAGIASGVLAMNRCMAGALLLAVSGAVFQSHGGGFGAAAGAALIPAAIVVAIGTVLTWALVRTPTRAGAPIEAEHLQHHRRFHL